MNRSDNILGVNLDELVKLCAAAGNETKEGDRENCIISLTHRVQEALSSARDLQNKLLPYPVLSCLCPCMHWGNYLTTVLLFQKVSLIFILHYSVLHYFETLMFQMLSLATIFLATYLLTVALQLSLADLYQFLVLRNSWEHTGLFPRTVFCDVDYVIWGNNEKHVFRKC